MQSRSWKTLSQAGMFMLALSLAPAHAAECRTDIAAAVPQPGTVSPLLFGTHLLFNQATDNIRSKSGFMDSLLTVPVRNLRFPGGTIGDNYLWERRETAHQDWFPFNHKSSANDLDFDEFMQTVKCLGAQATIVLNLRTWVAANKVEDGFAEAEAWVTYAKQKGYNVKYWEFGNELYGKKAQVQAPMPSRQYGQYYATLRERLKKIDPNVELGLIMPRETDFVADGDREQWWDGAAAGSDQLVDYIVIHRYMVMPANAVVKKGSNYGETISAARAKARSLFGKDVPIHFTEWNLGSRNASNPKVIRHDKLGHALFVADAIVDQADQGVRLANFWPLIGPKDQGFLDGSSLALNVPGKVMKMMSAIAGWKVTQHARNDEGLQTSLYANASGQVAAVLINWSGTPARFDWKARFGNCPAAGTAIVPSKGGRPRNALNSDADELSVDVGDGVATAQPYSVTIVRSMSGQVCKAN